MAACIGVGLAENVVPQRSLTLLYKRLSDECGQKLVKTTREVRIEGCSEARMVVESS